MRLSPNKRNGADSYPNHLRWPPAVKPNLQGACRGGEVPAPSGLLDRHGILEDIEVPFQQLLHGGIKGEEFAAETMLSSAHNPGLNHYAVSFGWEPQRQFQQLPIPEMLSAIYLDIEPGQAEVQNACLNIHPYDGDLQVKIDTGAFPHIINVNKVSLEFYHGRALNLSIQIKFLIILSPMYGAAAMIHPRPLNLKKGSNMCCFVVSSIPSGDG